jgi:glycosyltransferase involved in cell wall biosynthesis
MRIVHLNPFYLPYAGGIERRIEATARHLARDHEVHVVTARQPGTPRGATDEDGVTVHRLESTFRFKRLYNPPVVSTPGLDEALGRIAPDVVDYHFRWSSSYNQAFRRVDAARVLTYHNAWGEGRGLLGVLSRIHDARFRPTVEAAHRVACVSGFIRRDLERHGIDPGRLRVVPNGIEANGHAPDPGEPDTAVPRPYVVSVGRLVHLKGLETLVDALARMPDEVHVVLVGEGPQAGRLRRRARRLGVEDRLHLTGWVKEAEKRRLLRHAAAYVHPSRSEAFGMSVLEALAEGTPVVAARVGGLPEVVGEAGVLLGHDAVEWAEAAARMALEPDHRAALAAKAKKQAASFRWDATARRLAGVYEEAIDAAG